MKPRVRLLLAGTVAVALLIGAGSVAAQQGGMSFTVKATARGGTVSTPRATELRFAFSAVPGSGGVQATPSRAYQLLLGRVRARTSMLPACTAAAMNGAHTNASCPARSRIGEGTIEALIGATGAPVSGSSDCRGVVSFYAAGRGHLAMWIDMSPDTGCIAVVGQAVDVTVSTLRTGTQLQFTLPEDLRHLATLDVSVIGLTGDLARIVRVRGRVRGAAYLASVCTSRRRRTSTLTVIDESGVSRTVKTAAAC